MVYVYVSCMCMFMCVQVHMYPALGVGWKLILSVFPSYSIPYMLEQSLLLNQELTNLASLASCSGNRQSLPSVCWDHR